MSNYRNISGLIRVSSLVELAGCPCSNLGKLGLVAERIAVGMAKHMVELPLAKHTGCKQ